MRRMRISVSEYGEKMLTLLAERDNVSLSAKASQLVEQSLDSMEDEYWNVIAHNRETQKGTRFITHEQAWE